MHFHLHQLEHPPPVPSSQSRWVHYLHLYCFLISAIPHYSTRSQPRLHPRHSRSPTYCLTWSVRRSITSTATAHFDQIANLGFSLKIVDCRLIVVNCWTRESLAISDYGDCVYPTRPDGHFHLELIRSRLLHCHCFVLRDIYQMYLQTRYVMATLESSQLWTEIHPLRLVAQQFL